MMRCREQPRVKCYDGVEIASVREKIRCYPLDFIFDSVDSLLGWDMAAVGEKRSVMRTDWLLYFLVYSFVELLIL